MSSAASSVTDPAAGLSLHRLSSHSRWRAPGPLGSRAGRRWRFGIGLLALGAATLLGGCSTFNEGFARVDRQIVAGDVKAAQANHEKLRYPNRDRALQQLNRGMLLRLDGDLAAANVALETAKATMEELSKLSLAEQAGSLVSNDEFRAYEGLVHERIYVHLIKAINYLQLGERHSARVEILQLDLLMRELASGETAAVERAAPFARYLSGLIYDALDEPSDAMIAYRQALAAYRAQRSMVPEALQDDLLRLSRRIGLSEEYEKFRKEFGRPAPTSASKEGELVAIVFDGLAPGLRENSVVWPDLVGNSGRLFRISLPAVGYRSYVVTPPELRGDTGTLFGRGELVDDLDRLVRADLDARKPAMAARAVARQALKQGAATAASRAAQRKADNSGEQLAAGLLSIGMQFASVLSERADTRNWSTLPGRIWLIRQALPAGQHALRITFGGQVRQWPGVAVTAGEKTFVVWHRIGPGGALAGSQ